MLEDIIYNLNKKATTANNICMSNELPGSFLIQPLKTYHSFFVKEIKNSHSCLKKCASLVVNVVTAIFAYPLLVALAAVGFLVKLTGIPALKNHNRTQKAILDTLRPQKGKNDTLHFLSSQSIPEPTIEPGMIMEVDRFTLKIEPRSPGVRPPIECAIYEMQERVDYQTFEYRRIYISAGFEQDNDQQLKVGLHVLKRNKDFS